MSANTEMVTETRILLEACVRGDAVAWRRFVQLTEVPIRQSAGAALRRARGHAAAGDIDDVAQAVLASLWSKRREKLRSFNGTASLESWVAVIAARTALNFARTESRKEGRRFADRVRKEEPTPEQLREYLPRLKPRFRAALALRYYEGMTPREIAELLHLTPSSVRSLLSRAARELRRIVVAI